MALTLPQLIGLLLSIAGIAGLAVYSGMKTQSSSSSGSSDSGAPSPIVAGIIMGTLVGGSSTVGTAQLAYSYGMSAWWFTLGGGIGCLILALGFARPLRAGGSRTLVGILRREYGPAAGMAASLLNSVGTFINVISQLLAGTAVIAVVLPNLGTVPALAVTAAFMALYVIAGGTRGTGTVGLLKLFLLYISMIGCGIMVLAITGGLSGFLDLVSTIDNPEGVRFSSLFARGVGKDVGACLSLILGILTTQTYAQAVLVGRSDRDARTGALISAVLIPPIGIGGILVGLYMRATAPGIAAKTALTAFTMQRLPGLLGGIVLGTLFIAVVGTGAGLAMGISSIIRCDILQRLSDRFSDPKTDNLLSRVIIVLVLLLASCLSSGPLGDTILNFAFMSMGLRGAVVFVPLCFALWQRNKVNHTCALIGIILGPLAVLFFGTLIPLPFDSLFAGVAAALLCCVIGRIIGRRHEDILPEQTVSFDLSKLVITIDSELCAREYEIAEAMSADLNIPCFGGAEILARASQITGIPERLFHKFENRPAAAEYDVISRDSVGYPLPSTEAFVRAQQDACLSLAEEYGSCILMNHFASAAMADHPNCVSLFVHADREHRADTYAGRRGPGPASTRRAMRRADRIYSSYYRSGNPDWGRKKKYAFYINSEEASPEHLARDMLDYLRAASAAD